MRLSWLLPLITLASPIIAKSAAITEDDDAPKPTKFNGLEVPPITELRGDTFDDDIKNGYWYGT
jgi:protein disulfide-isomerase